MKKSGFTLVEVMFVVAIIGLLASLGIPAILDMMEQGEEKLKKNHIATIEKAKAMLQLPDIIYGYGLGLKNGTPFESDGYSEEALMQCVQNATRLSDFEVGGEQLVPGDIGQRAYYIDGSALASDN